MVVLLCMTKSKRSKKVRITTASFMTAADDSLLDNERDVSIRVDLEYKVHHRTILFKTETKPKFAKQPILLSRTKADLFSLEDKLR